MFGHDRNRVGAVPAGGKLHSVNDGTVFGFFSWRNIREGSKIVIRIMWGKETQREIEFSPRAAISSSYVGIISYGSPSGGSRFTFGDVSMAILVDGTEFARGGVALD